MTIEDPLLRIVTHGNMLLSKDTIFKGLYNKLFPANGIKNTSLYAIIAEEGIGVTRHHLEEMPGDVWNALNYYTGQIILMTDVTPVEWENIVERYQFINDPSGANCSDVVAKRLLKAHKWFLMLTILELLTKGK